MRKWMLASLLCLPGCIQTKLNNAERLMSHPQFPAATQAAPDFVRETLRTVNALEEQLEAQP